MAGLQAPRQHCSPLSVGCQAAALILKRGLHRCQALGEALGPCFRNCQRLCLVVETCERGSGSEASWIANGERKKNL